MRVTYKGVSATLWTVTSNSFGDQLLTYSLFIPGVSHQTHVEVRSEGDWIEPKQFLKQVTKDAHQDLRTK